jgi:CSLREA domain-containing protein
MRSSTRWSNAQFVASGKSGPRLAVLLAAVCTLLFAVPATAGAVPFTVNDEGDAGTGGCTTEECTLREAIEAANTAAGTDSIEFADTVSFITPESGLPDLTGTVIVDGTMHPDASPGFPAVHIDGSIVNADGLRLMGAGSSVRTVAIDGFGGAGIRLGGTGGHTVIGNTIGRDEPVGGDGIAVESSGNMIGGTADGEGNAIVGSGGDGVSVLSGANNAISGNAIRANAELGIDLAPDGPTPNDALDVDVGANGLQNFPLVTAATDGPLGLSVTATLASKASTAYAIHFYSADGCAGSGSLYLGSASIMTNGSGNGSVAATVDSPQMGSLGLVATATDPSGNTSEFGPLRELAGPAATGVVPKCDAGELARAMSFDPTQVVGASWVAIPDGTPDGIATTALAGFPSHSSDYAILASGDVRRLAPDGPGESDLQGPNVRGDTDFDVSILKVDLQVPAARNCLSIDFRFLSEEYPDYLNTEFNDAFIAELDSSTWTTSGSTISAPGNFAFDPSGEVISINSTGNTAMSHAAAAGTGYFADPDQGGSTPTLRANKVITPGAHSLYLSLFDQGDHVLDSAVFLDNLVLSTKSPAACASGATSDLTPPVVTLDDPADDATIGDTTPTYDGTAGDASGDLLPVTVKVYAGTEATGTPVQTLVIDRTGTTWTVDGTDALAPGTYTARAEQSDNAGNTGFSEPHTFTIASGPVVSIGDRTVTEGDIAAEFAVTLSQPAASTVTVAYATADGTASQPGDYTAASGTVTFAPGDTSETVTVQVKGDTLDEVDETYTVGLSSPQNATIGDGNGLGTITDDDAPPTVSIGDRNVVEGNSGTTAATFAVSLSAPSGKQVTVDYATADDTARQPADYGPASGTLTFAPGQVSKTIAVAVVGDTVIEQDETYTVGLSGAVNAGLADATGLGTIANDDVVLPPVVPAITIAGATVTPEGNAGTKDATFAVTLSRATTVPVSVQYATANGTASAAADYAAASGTLTFAPGETAKAVVVKVNGDTLVEPNETFTVALSVAAGGTLGTAQATGTIVDDDKPKSQLPGKVRPDGLFCGTQHRGRCLGLKVKGEFGGPGNASWVLDAYNPNPGKGGVKRVRLARVTRKITAAGTVQVVFKLKGRKTDGLLRKVRKAKLRSLQVTTTFTDASGRTTKSTGSCKLR